jgi:beta-lactamase regulating signal transducer with metallopeptidase domain
MTLSALSSAALIQTLIAAIQGVIPAAADSLTGAFRGFAQQAATVAVAAIWQSALIAGGLAICLRLAPRASAAHRFSVWAAAFGTLVSLPLLTLVLDLPAAVAAVDPAAGPEAAIRPWLSIDARWSLAIAALWAAATMFRAGDLVLHSVRLRKLWKDAIPVEVDGTFSSMLAAAAMRCRGTVEVCTTKTLQRPSVIGFFKPRILIPDWLFTRLTHGELQQIVLHEAEHLRRHDDWTNLLQKICLVLFPLNPALLWIERRLCREREMACDDGVIRITHAPRAYAACLASLAERGLQRRAEALSLGAWQRRPELVHRVHSILRRKSTLGPLGTRALLSALGCGLLFGSVELARSPQLVAFVPTQNQNRSLDATKGNVSVRSQVASARLINTAYVPVRSAGAGHGSSGLRATNLEAILPASRAAQLSDAHFSMRRIAMKQDAAITHETPPHKSDSSAPRPVMLKAILDGAQPASAQEQQWIVLTTWEQVQTSNRSAGLTADYETGANANATGDPVYKNGQSSSQPTGQITVTRLILRIFPASSSSTQPALVPTRNGWLMLQL